LRDADAGWLARGSQGVRLKTNLGLWTKKMNEFTGVLGVVGSISGKRTFLLVMGLGCFIPGLTSYMEHFERKLSSKKHP